MLQKKIRRDSLNCLTNPQISHRWGSGARNSPLVPLMQHTPEGVEALFCISSESCPNVI